MLGYPSAISLKAVYGQLCKRALVEQRRAVLFLTHYESPTSIRYTLKEYDISTQQHETLGSLVIVDAPQILSKSNTPVDFARYLETFGKSSERRGMGGTQVIIDMGAFYHLSKLSELAEFEESISKITASFKTISILCCYHMKDLGKSLEKEPDHLPCLHSGCYVIEEG